MGSLKEEMRSVKEDHQPSERGDDGGLPGSSDGSCVPEGAQINTAPESTTQGGYQPKLHMEGNVDPLSEDRALSVGVCDSTDQSDSIGVSDCAQTESGPLTQKPEADKTAAAHHDVTDKLHNEEEDQNIEAVAGYEEIQVPVPPTPNPADPFSPAPFGQHHMRTQVSLEVVQCHSAATSPMTPPEGGHSSSFFFPHSPDSGTKDAELQVGRQVEFCSVATSPMTPKTPSATAFPELVERKWEKAGGQRESCEAGSSPSTTGPAEPEPEMKPGASTEPSEGLATRSSGEGEKESILEESGHQSKQQRMGSMDQDITILVTHHGHAEGDQSEQAESPVCPVEPEMVKIEECEEGAQDESQEKKNQGGSESPRGETKTIAQREQPKATESKDEEPKPAPAPKPAVPESPAPFGCHNIRTQVSLEVVQCQSVATSPMTPQEGDSAFYFPSSLGGQGAETKDAEMQVGQRVEFRSVATAPMTPRTPTVTYFPEVVKGASIEEKIVEEEEEEEGEEKAEKKEEEEVAGEAEKGKEGEEGDEKCEEPVQDVSWDEKGMTWEVYGAVVEVAVLGSAIQKHLEKQVMKQQKKQPSLQPPAPNPSSSAPAPPPAPPPPEPAQGCSGSGKGRAGKRGDGKASRRRRNPFRLLMENMQQPHCCSRAHTTE